MLLLPLLPTMVPPSQLSQHQLQMMKTASPPSPLQPSGLPQLSLLLLAAPMQPPPLGRWPLQLPLPVALLLPTLQVRTLRPALGQSRPQLSPPRWLVLPEPPAQAPLLALPLPAQPRPAPAPALALAPRSFQQ